jgi:hypothetical protein
LQFDRDLRSTLRSLVDLQIAAGKFAAARANLATSVALLVKLKQTFPNDKAVAEELARVRSRLEEFDREHPASAPDTLTPKDGAPALPKR